LLPKKIKFTYQGALKSSEEDRKNDLLLRIFEKVGACQLIHVDSVAEADFVLAYPYDGGKLSFKLKWITASFLYKLLCLKDSTTLLKWILGVGNKPTLFVSHENLDRHYWWKVYGKLLSASNLSRITFWPKSIDPKGVRFPYWYNYLQWAAYPRENFYSRYGRLYEIEVLMAPLKGDLGRQNKAVCITSHLDYPRLSLLEDIQLSLPVDIYGNAGVSFAGDKYSLMRQYRYAFCPENSVGYGYDTEKIPEAWIAGCIPICAYLNPFSDFNPEILKLSKGVNELPEKTLLLLQEPTLTEIEEYVKEFIQQNYIGDAHIQGDTSFSRGAGLN
jgi:hypothetical protein